MKEMRKDPDWEMGCYDDEKTKHSKPV